MPAEVLERLVQFTSPRDCLSLSLTCRKISSHTLNFLWHKVELPLKFSEPSIKVAQKLVEILPSHREKTRNLIITFIEDIESNFEQYGEQSETIAFQIVKLVAAYIIRLEIWGICKPKILSRTASLIPRVVCRFSVSIFHIWKIEL